MPNKLFYKTKSIYFSCMKYFWITRKETMGSGRLKIGGEISFKCFEEKSS